MKKPGSRLRRVLRFVGRGIFAFVAVVLVGFTLANWWTHPKRATDSVFVRPAGPEVFRMADIPADHEPTETEVEGHVDRLLAGMTLVDKVGQMSGDTWIWDMVRLIAFEGFKYNDRPIPSGRDRRLGIPPLLFADGPRGVVLNHSTAFPVALARGASWDRALEGRVADAIGEELRAQGANFYGGVCINVLRHPGWGRAQETYGEDPYLLGEMGAALIEGVQRHHVMACAKHFALNSIEEVRHTVDVRADERTLREVYLPHFKRAVDAGVASVMSAYNRVNGDYCAENRWLLQDVLKDDWGFRGFVMSDFVQGVYDGPKAARAGLDVEMPWGMRSGAKLVRAVETGAVPGERIDEAVRRILRRKIFYATRRDLRSYGPELVVSPAHVALAREVAEKSMVLLKNEGPLLPLDRTAIRNLAVLGRRAEADNLGDHGSSRVYPPRVVTLLEGLREAVAASGRVVYETGADLGRARTAARQADAVVLVAGLDHHDEGEWIPQKAAGERGGDRRSLALHQDEQELIRATARENRRVVVVLVGGSAITAEEWKHDVPAILMAWYPGMEGGRALARILFGDANPSGKLTVTVPGDSSWLPPFDPAAKAVDYGYFHGYTLADRKGVEPAFPFGFGLAYTRFRYSALRLSTTRIAPSQTLVVSVDVSNEGERPGEEIVQLYVGFPPSNLDRPVKLLRGFDRIPLAPHETRTVRFSLKAADLAYYDVLSHSWLVEGGEHTVLVGGSSRDRDLTSARVTVDGGPLHP